MCEIGRWLSRDRRERAAFDPSLTALESNAARNGGIAGLEACSTVYAVALPDCMAAMRAIISRVRCGTMPTIRCISMSWAR